QGFEWSRKIYGVLCTRRVQTTLMGNDQLKKGARGNLPLRYLIWLNCAKHAEINPPRFPFFKGGSYSQFFKLLSETGH
ncbi:MAG: hypothetical protein ACREOR_09375, partial [Candidatus Binatia bacterium]